ncbi:MAG: hypothetical protein IJN85_05910 [Oscillospiraceae bacterium]|nr:hypothetical protein [Oscillospiraceae bacterium]
MKNIFKKSLAVFSSILTVGLIAASGITASAQELRNGDTNSDGVVNLYDAVNISKHVMGDASLEGDALIMADYNKDSKVNIYDAVFVARYILAEGKLNELATLINTTRMLNNAMGLEFDQTLTDAAMKRAAELPNKFSGDYRPDGSDFFTIFAEYDIAYESCATCVAAVPATPEEVLSAFLGSSTVRTKLMSDQYTKIGIGYCGMNDDYKHYWAVLLI